MVVCVGLLKGGLGALLSPLLLIYMHTQPAFPASSRTKHLTLAHASFNGNLVIPLHQGEEMVFHHPETTLGNRARVESLLPKG
jgi:hypothetical protein